MTPIFTKTPSSNRRQPAGRASAREDGRGHGRRRTAGLFLLFALPLLFFPPSVATQGDPFLDIRQDMVEEQVKRRGHGEIAPSVLTAMVDVPRHLFVPKNLEELAYEDRPVEIAPGKTLSQAYVSARMIDLLELDGDEKVLEIGTGSGYDAALLSRLAKQVYTIEIDSQLGVKAREKLDLLGYENIEVRVGDGYRGWPEEAPFDAILLTAAPHRVPEPLFQQLAIGGRMVVAVGNPLHQDLKVIVKTPEGDRQMRRVSLISLAPMTGEIDDQPGE